jgi:rhomboid protease GluP
VGTGAALWAFGGKYGPGIREKPEWWRLVTAGFLHGGLLHIAMNSWVLYDLGAQVEQVFGTPRFLTIYFFGTVGGFYLSYRVHPDVLSIGSSAGIMGLVGAMVAFGVANRSSIGREIRNHYFRYVIYIFAFGIIGGFGVDNWAHLGGLAGGFAIGWIAGTPVRSTHAKEALWRGVAALCVIVTIFCFALMYRSFPQPGQLR